MQFESGSESVDATAGTFSIPVTLAGVTSDPSTFAAGFVGSVDVAFDAAGNLFVANKFGDTVSEVTPAGSSAPSPPGSRRPWVWRSTRPATCSSPTKPMAR
ncbi:hypothetical protein [Fimbriiglobus ruber]|uniref:Uncharacterized protein n=1 Tax=Fimbriiglobus ruber TaxID=1908690 RepID=A0A225DHQ2_9BACT|nr:hypothetical protein [Fimbriiglobus ruber]OWK35895.1 hypothetical protein FRUB_08458 [Fimbriiglobus ruber]